MDFRGKVVGGTVRGDAEHLCANCRHAVHVEGESPSKTKTFCTMMPSKYAMVDFKVVKCNEFDDQRLTRLRDYEQLAYVITPKKGLTGDVGFVRLRDLKKRGEDDGS